MFQILHSTALLFDKNITEEELLNNPIKSAKIAAKYIKQLIKTEKNKDNTLTDDELIKIAITKYNWGLSARFNSKNKTDIFKTIYLIYKELIYIKSRSKESIDSIIELIIETEKKFFNIDRLEKWKSNFRILEHKNPTKEDINNWIDRYIEKILKQQAHYPIQFNAIKNVIS